MNDDLKQAAQACHHAVKQPWTTVIGTILVFFGLGGLAEDWLFTLPGPWWAGFAPLVIGLYLMFPNKVEGLAKVVGKARSGHEHE